MALFDDKPEEVINEVEKIKLGDQEFTQSELQELVGLGKQTREIEQKYNTKMDKVYPEYIKTTQELKEARGAQEKLTVLEAQIEAQKQGAQGLTEDQKEEARKQLMNIMGDEIMTKKNADQWYQQRRSQEKLAESIDGGVNTLMSEIGKDGRPAVTRDELLGFMGENNIAKPDVAYKILKEKELDEWKMSKLSSGKKGLYTVTHSSAGGKQPLEVRPNMENINDLISEALGGGE